MSISLLTNCSSMTTLQVLRRVANRMDTARQRISSSQRINQASDSTAYWSISSMMHSDRIALSAVSDAMALGKGQIDVAYAAVEKTEEYLVNVQKYLTAIYEKGSGGIRKIQADIKGCLDNMASVVQSASFAEKNIIGNNGQNVRIAGSYRREGSSVFMNMIDVGGPNLNFARANSDGTCDLTEGVLKDVFKKSNTDFLYWGRLLAWTEEKLRDAISTGAPDWLVEMRIKQIKAITDNFREELQKSFTVADFVDADLKGQSVSALEIIAKHLQGMTTNVTTNVVTAGAELGAARAQVEGQIDYVSKLVDLVDRGIGSLVDADMNTESARLASLQVQQQLGIQALSIANQNSQNILSLFRN